ncbi:transcriptional regulator, LuxR family [Rhodoferax sp. OV413]|uniref:XrtB/PEP-CTERM-associated transcriptional regulator EpsA n=1 Tax=Rhodoferax sp. OV413 TaxID=1855285 RepID=UPI00088E565B|nr:XrtB/PEP-CTERM-associated transcriptional regulator EpsA [Rhodoferax sp. OV413]SDP79066.1 transcriptional regulator, LuxR family [Rhodoferax sp. OV413]
MAFLPSLSFNELQHYHRVICGSVEVRNQAEMRVWLQGDMQRYLPHDILIAAWGQFAKGQVQHDIISPLTGISAPGIPSKAFSTLLQHWFARWIEFGRKPFMHHPHEYGFPVEVSGFALREMQSVMVHGIRDARGSHDCLYVIFSRRPPQSQIELSAMSVLLPYIDTALRQIPLQPRQTHATQPESQTPTGAVLKKNHGLSEREAEILSWVTEGKSNSEIGSILEISAFTVKNHMQRVFKKLNVSNRAQAVGKLKALREHA